MSKVGTVLQEVLVKLQTIPNMKSVKIGMEKGIGSKDSPFIRIVHEMTKPSGPQKTCNSVMQEISIQVIYGFDLKNHELQALTLEFLDLDEQIQTALLTKYNARCHAEYNYTVTDEDKLQNIKSAIARYTIKGIR